MPPMGGAGGLGGMDPAMMQQMMRNKKILNNNYFIKKMKIRCETFFFSSRDFVCVVFFAYSIFDSNFVLRKLRMQKS